MCISIARLVKEGTGFALAKWGEGTVVPSSKERMMLEETYLSILLLFILASPLSLLLGTHQRNREGHMTAEFFNQFKLIAKHSNVFI